VTRVFGIPGGALVGMLAALKASPVTYHICRQETGAAYMADGYARVGGGLGVVVVTSGPGATNALTGLLNADASRTPLLVISGEVKEQFFGRGYLQEGVDADLDIVSVFGSAIGFSEIITNADNFQELFEAAMRRAWAYPHRATHLSLPSDVAAAAPDGFTPPASPSAYRANTSYVDEAGVQAAVAAIAAAKRPALMLGNRCRGPLQDATLLTELEQAVEQLSVPVLTSPDAKGVFPESHELSLRNYGIAGCKWPQHYLKDPTAGQYDTLVVIGSSLGELATNTWDPILMPNGPLIQIDEDPTVLGRAFPVKQGVVGETRGVLRAFVAAAASANVDPAAASARRSSLATMKSTVSPFVDDKRDSTCYPIKPQALARMVAEAVPRGGHIMVDAGNCVGWCMHEMVIDPPTAVHSALAMGPMGFATAAVVGAKLASPGATCVAVVGDGGFMMHVGEVATAAQYGVGAIWVVLADHDLAMVSQGMAAVTTDKSYVDYYKIGWNDLAAVAQGMGAAAYTVDSVETAATALQSALAGAATGVPQVIVVGIDTTEMPPYSYGVMTPPPPTQPRPAGTSTSASPSKSKSKAKSKIKAKSRSRSKSKS
jgi:acetolactate synthase-1/2/3 large subunit